MTNKAKTTAADLIEKLRFKYGNTRGYVVLEQVAPGTGMYSWQHIDAVVVAAWPSKGLTRSAFEIKVSRSDFLVELKNPNKNKFARESFHEFWYVTAKDVVRHVDEIPANCGWMMPHGKTLKIVKAATRKDDPVLDDLLLCSLVRNAAEMYDTRLREFKLRVRDSILAESREHQEALAFKKAVDEFLDRRNLWCAGEDSTKIIAKLEEAGGTDAFTKERTHVLEVLKRFGNRIQDLFDVFAAVAHIAMTERNDAGRFIIEKYSSDIREKDLAYYRAEEVVSKSKQDFLKKLEGILNA